MKNNWLGFNFVLVDWFPVWLKNWSELHGSLRKWELDHGTLRKELVSEATPSKSLMMCLKMGLYRLSCSALPVILPRRRLSRHSSTSFGRCGGIFLILWLFKYLVMKCNLFLLWTMHWLCLTSLFCRSLRDSYNQMKFTFLDMQGLRFQMMSYEAAYEGEPFCLSFSSYVFSPFVFLINANEVHLPC